MEKPRLLEQVRQAVRVRQFSLRTEDAYVFWIKRYIYFHHKRHPGEMGEREITKFLTHLAVDRHVAPTTQNQALSALLFLYKAVLGKELEWMDEIVCAKRPQRVPTVFTRSEVQAILVRLTGLNWLIASLLYGAGLRLSECLRLRIKDIDFEYRQIIVRDGKGQKDRVTLLPSALDDPLKRQLEHVRTIFESDQRDRQPGVSLPYALRTNERLLYRSTHERTVTTSYS